MSREMIMRIAYRLRSIAACVPGSGIVVGWSKTAQYNTPRARVMNILAKMALGGHKVSLRIRNAAVVRNTSTRLEARIMRTHMMARC